MTKLLDRFHFILLGRDPITYRDSNIISNVSVKLILDLLSVSLTAKQQTNSITIISTLLMGAFHYQQNPKCHIKMKLTGWEPKKIKHNKTQ